MDKLSGAYVEGDINVLIDSFAENYYYDEGDESVTDTYYIVPIGEEEYYALKVEASKYEVAEQIRNETYEYMIGDKDELTTTMHVVGTFEKMEDDIYDWYLDWFRESGFEEDTSDEHLEQVAMPYVLKINYVGDFDHFATVIGLVVCGLIFLYIIVVLIKGLTSMYLAPIKKYLKKNDGLINEVKLDAEYQSSLPVEDMRVGSRYTFYFTGCKAKILHNRDIIWAYLESVTHKWNGIKTGVTKALVFIQEMRRN